MDGAAKYVSLDDKLAGDVLYILGETKNELDGSEFAGMIQHNDGKVPEVDAEKNSRLYKALYNAIQKDLVASAVSIGRGGLITALSKMLIAGALGAEVSLLDLPGAWDENYQALFSESQGRILVSVDPKKAEAFESAMADNVIAKIGIVTKKDKLIITDKDNKKIVDLRIKEATKAYKSTFKGY